jgi:hypothetical protein
MDDAPGYLAPLTTYLAESGKSSVELTLAQIERIIGRSLPRSSYDHRPFWSNSSQNRYSRAWTDAGYRTTTARVQSNAIRFERSGPTAGGRRDSAATAVVRQSSTPTAAADVILVGCVKSKLDHAAPACDLYVSELFRRRRAYAEARDARWFILSARHGLVAPRELLEPYDVHLVEQSTDYRDAWGHWVAARLATEMDVSGKTVEIHAGATYVDAVRSHLGRRGAVVVTPLAGLAQGEQLAWYATQGESESAVRVAASAATFEDVVAELGDPTNAKSSREFPWGRLDLDEAGLYSWWVDAEGAQQLAAGLGHDIAPGLIYAGQTSATRSRSRKASRSTLLGRVGGNHLRGSIRGSTFRLTLAACLRTALALEAAGAQKLDARSEQRLSDWMLAHLAVICVPYAGREGLLDVEAQAIHRLNPPLNRAGAAVDPRRVALRALRGGFGRRRSASVAADVATVPPTQKGRRADA